MKILLLEDDMQLGRASIQALAQEGFLPRWLRRVQEARSILECETFAAALVDVGLPDGSGLELLQWLRKRGSPLPVLLLAARNGVKDRLGGLDVGADGYLPKPFAVSELVARVRALMGRNAGSALPIWRAGALSIDPVRREVRHGDALIDVSPTEFQILVELVRHQGQMVSKRTLVHAVFCLSDSDGNHALEVHVHNLRRKLPDGVIGTVRSMGYLIR